jgi:hypothetical protein
MMLGECISLLRSEALFLLTFLQSSAGKRGFARFASPPPLAGNKSVLRRIFVPSWAMRFGLLALTVSGTTKRQSKFGRAPHVFLTRYRLKVLGINASWRSALVVNL